MAVKLEGRILLKRQKEEKSKNVRALYVRSEASYFHMTYDYFFFSNPPKLIGITFTLSNEEEEMLQKILKVTQLSKQNQQDSNPGLLSLGQLSMRIGDIVCPQCSVTNPPADGVMCSVCASCN